MSQLVADHPSAKPNGTADTRTAEPLDKAIISVKALLSDQSLRIPEYQRPYKWGVRNVNQLFGDITKHQGKSSYRLGTIVFHKEKGCRNIVDGQQRTITLLLIVKAFLKERRDQVEDHRLKKHLSDFDAQGLIDPEFDSEISHLNIYRNYQEICRLVTRPDFTEELMVFLLEKCQLVTFSLENVSEAFQFFDSQNARGRDLEPHDLLKAYHLREFTEADESLKAATVAQWENSETEELANLFALYLYRIRNWAKDSSARYFGKNDTGLFKGVNMEKIADYPYVEQLRMAHHFVDHYNHQYERRIDHHRLDFPFHLDQIIINGRRFFELVSHYQNKVKDIRHAGEKLPPIVDHTKLDELPRRILDTLNTYSGRNRTGDRYTRSIFDCLLLYYVDKFGLTEISRAVEKIFIWSYTLRLRQQVVQLASMDNHVLDNGNLFKLVRESTHPSEFLSYPLDTLQEKDVHKTEATKAIRELFEEMRYYAV
ncbi:DUF262 domain-containing protein [Sulfuriroseicoccus oceanibius]|uniref:DUF262 domain-containing protein n=1 Tax=Sulfuriroseicoccus oceanibius TaxID=2707525 RepID=A0A6B3L1Y6_9BACT|nr:DUF262 domain-containing protein [Sulfuriroseicoccus oceanibius]QQL43717.1 DUF262 domain-containing protein [Sulfuriroseicoccus oceanibius]